MRLAIPKGRLMSGVLDRLTRAELELSFAGDRDYRPRCNDPRVTARLFKPRAIPQLVAMGRYDAGFCGLDLVLESGYEQVLPLADLGLNAVELVVAVPRGLAGLLKSPPKRPVVIATEYPMLASRWALEHNLAAIVLQTWGSTEAYAPDDADVVLDCVETGRTLEANGLVVLERLARSTTWFVVEKRALDDPERGPTLRELATRLEAEDQ